MRKGKGTDPLVIDDDDLVDGAVLAELVLEVALAGSDAEAEHAEDGTGSLLGLGVSALPVQTGVEQMLRHTGCCAGEERQRGGRKRKARLGETHRNVGRGGRFTIAVAAGERENPKSV